MKTLLIWVSALLVPVSLALGAAAAPVVIATHGVFAEFVEVVGGEHITVRSIIPSGFCPGHYDLRPSDVAAVVEADLIFFSGFEVWMETLTRAAGSGAEVVQLVGSWNTPDAAHGKVEDITAALRARYPQHAADFDENARAYIEELEQLAAELRERAEALRVSQVPVLSIAWQASFLSWLGFDIVATYPPPETLSIRDLVELAAKGREADAQLVVDNLQSGVRFGAKLAAEFGAENVVLSNFPGAMPNTATVLDLLRENAEALFWALAPWGEVGERDATR